MFVHGTIVIVIVGSVKNHLVVKLVSWQWFGRRWYEFRQGYQTYMVFLFGFSNFILILYNFVPQFKDIIDLPYFIVLTFVIIVPVGVLIGHFHNKTQVPTESRIQNLNHAFRDKIVPDSKETFSTKSAIFNLELSEWQTNYSRWQLQLSKKQFKMMNAIAKKLDVPEMFGDQDFIMLEQMDVDLAKWAEGIETWKKRNQYYLQGEEASKAAEK